MHAVMSQVSCFPATYVVVPKIFAKVGGKLVWDDLETFTTWVLSGG